tara:strand:- start:199 stop:1233 length:1035 start_codon:yes stop_codon:yes gene_type:complete
MKVGIINVTGYAGSELARILNQHNEIDIVSITGRSSVGKKIGDVFPHLSKINLTITEELDSNVEFVFSALPHLASAESLNKYFDKNIKIVDISADFRLKNKELYKIWYDYDHVYPNMLNESVYGLPEIYREEILSANIVANPGCYPTASILALAPLVKNNIINEDIIIDAKSGVSGAGRSLSLKTHFSEMTENMLAYSTNNHRHMPEIKQELDFINPNINNKITFVPHLAPMVRGILATCYTSVIDSTLKEGDNGQVELLELYKDFYSTHPFVQISDFSPMTKQTLGSNNCIIYPYLDNESRKIIVISAIDNLVKGAAGQAVQNMNIMCGFNEDEGLKQLAIYP